MKSYTFKVPEDLGGGHVTINANSEAAARIGIADYYGVVNVDFLELQEVF